MINRRAPRPSRAVENLQQFCLNNSAGIDCTAPHSNVKNIYDSTNLIPNPDGSLSLRKPLLIKRDWSRIVRQKIGTSYTVLRVIPLYTEHTYLLIILDTSGTKSITIWDTDSFVESCKLMWFDKDSVQHVKEFFSTETTGGVSVGGVYSTDESSSLAMLDDVKAYHSASTTVLCNCKVGLNSEIFDNHPLSDTSLYTDYSKNDLVWMPRFIKVYRNYLHQWFFEVYTPETNVFEMNASTGVYEHPINTALDDAYNLQDVYDTPVPIVKQIVPYVYTKRLGNTVVVDNYVADTETTSVNYLYTWNSNQTDDSSYTKSDLPITANDSKTYDFGTFSHNSYARYEYTNGIVHIYFTQTISFKASADVPYVHLSGTHAFYGAVNLTHSFFEEQKKDSRTAYNVKSGTTVTLELRSNTSLSVERLTHIDLGIPSYANCSARYGVTTTIPKNPSVQQLTESVGDCKFRGVNMFAKDTSVECYLKAFCNIPNKTTVPNTAGLLQYYAGWFYTCDGGKSWLSLNSNAVDGTHDYENIFNTAVMVKATVEEPVKSVDIPIDNSQTDTYCYVPLYNDNGINRVDILKISKTFFQNHFKNATFRFKIVLLHGTGEDHDPYEIVGTYGQADYMPVFSNTGEYWYSETGNSVLGEKVYHKSRIFSFGDPSFKNNIFVSEPGEFVIPFKNTIDINASEDSVVTAITPWKDYLFVSTPQALYLVSQVESGWITKTANAALGVSQTDAKCVVAALNGVIFKSGTKVYMFYPNIYAGDDSVINVTDISSPIEHLLEGFDNVSGAFAFGTDSEYVLMLPKTQGTLCLSYDYNTRVWTKTEYLVQFTKHIVNSLTDIVLFGQNPEGSVCEYHYNKTFAEAYGNDVGAPYGDILVESEDGIRQDVLSYGTTNSTLKISPITFGLDTGQKAEAIVTTKQFVETKFVLATLDKADAFPMQLTVHIDGDPHIITRDISTDAAFWKDNPAKGVLNTTFSGLSDKSDTFNVLRQLVVRYSGKGKSIRHILEGQSLSNFKLYETYIRYKLLNVKQ